ncbi:MAG: hypothetical protein ACFFGZ_06055 [Candidatus Thorarchaeota archaeon]
MKVFLDSSYFFPLIGVREASIDQQFIPRLVRTNQLHFYYSTITLFEISAKGAKLIRDNKLSETNVVDGLNSIRNWEEMRSVDPWLGEIQRLSFYFRRDHKDFIDCLILASAVVQANIFVTEDQQLRELADSAWKKAISDLNPKFRIYNSSEMIDMGNKFSETDFATD